MNKVSNRLLLRALIAPESLPDLQLAEWDRLLPEARRSGLLGRIALEIIRLGVLHKVPERVRPHLEAESINTSEHARMIRWEVDRISRAMSGLKTTTVLLKGAAYLLLGLPCSRGRLVSDVDIMVDKTRLTEVELVLRQHGWESLQLDEYDQNYYRRWMHELPPLRHRMRQTVLDVHHTIAPPISRLHPDPTELLRATVPVVGMPRVSVLSAPDMVLHSAVHTFNNEELNHPVRDFLDIHDLVTHFSSNPEFWPQLSDRAFQLGLGRPLYYALHFAQMYFQTRVPEEAIREIGDKTPSWIGRRLMDQLLETMIFADTESAKWEVARLLLLARCHWLRMPPFLLARHLLRKSRRRLLERFASAAPDTS